jgi:hypothetical protein
VSYDPRDPPDLGPLFSPPPTPPKPNAAEVQDAELERVSSRIRGAILEFARAHLGQEFFADDLRKYVTAKCGETAPGSADRILRDLRQGRTLSYRVINRSKSLYVIDGV